MIYTHDMLSNRDKPEYIICAAVWFNDGVEREQQPYNITQGFIIAGRRHHNCFATILALREADGNTKKHFEIGKPTQGFLTSKDRFVTRKEAGQIAMQQKQILKETDMLFSEDLY